jgi:2-dehydro-3-deoxygalactonokinase
MGAAPAGVEWIAVDWGTTNLRAWAMQGEQVLAAAAEPLGMGGLAKNQFEPALLKTVGGWLTEGSVTPVVACGMVGARQGWIEAPYVSVPSPPHSADAFCRAATSDTRVAVTIVHGMSQADPADVMRGEETQIAGLLALRPGFSGLACLPGTHTKWAVVADGAVQSFRTFMTGELYGLAVAQSVLRHSVAGPDGYDDAAFDEAVAEIAADPAGLAARLFSTRASGLLRGMAAPAARSRISGLLVGLEVAAMQAAWSNAPVVLIGASAVSASYRRALTLLGAPQTEVLEADLCSLAGLAAARKLIG